MINKENTITVGELLKMLANGMISVDMPIVVSDAVGQESVTKIQPGSVLRGSLPVIEVYKFKDGSKAVALFVGKAVGDSADLHQASEVYL